MELPSTLSRYTPQNSKKRVFPGGSSPCMEAEVVEISPPPPPPSNPGSKSKSLKRKKVIFPEVIDLDLDEDCSPSSQTGDMVFPSDKGKELSGHTANKLKSATATTSNNSFSKSKLNNVGFTSGSNSSLFSWPLESTQIMSTPGSSSTSGTQLSSLSQARSSTWSFLEPALGKANLTAASGCTYLNLQCKDPVNLSSEKKHPKSLHFHSTSHQANKTFPVGAMSYVSSQTDFPIGASYAPTSIKQHGAYDNSRSNIATSITDWQGFLNVAGHAVGSSWVSQGSTGPPNSVPLKDKALNPLFNPALAPTAATTSEVPSLASSIKVEDSPNEVMKKVFKNFDTVQDFSDHYYYTEGSSVKQPSKNWTKKIQDEWRILEKDLPDTIFVRVCESRMDLLRAVIVGAEGTPYHDGLFFFDVFFPSNYPSVPPKVNYHSGGLRINPNLYNCGKVCLSLLNTWSGSQKEKWIPRTSTMLQVLVSIQGLILNAKPYFNEPGYASMSGSIAGENSSLQYNESTFILSLKTMVYNIRRPPKYFEDFVAGHFCDRAHDILVACQAYISGAQVGCLVKGGVQDVDEGDKSCSQAFRHNVAGFINTLIDAFKQVGANDCEKFLPLAQKAKGQQPAAHYPAY